MVLFTVYNNGVLIVYGVLQFIIVFLRNKVIKHTCVYTCPPHPLMILGFFSLIFSENWKSINICSKII